MRRQNICSSNSNSDDESVILLLILTESKLKLHSQQFTFMLKFCLSQSYKCNTSRLTTSSKLELKRRTQQGYLEIITYKLLKRMYVAEFN